MKLINDKYLITLSLSTFFNNDCNKLITMSGTYTINNKFNIFFSACRHALVHCRGVEVEVEEEAGEAHHTEQDEGEGDAAGRCADLSLPPPPPRSP